MNRERLEQAGGKYWESGDGRMRRVYFNDLAARYGLKYSTYNTGNVSSATLDGDHISNSDARRILGATENGKLWYDLDSGQWRSRDLDNHYFRNIGEKVVAQIEAGIAALVADGVDDVDEGADAGGERHG